jgi:hypothetical protein
MLVETLPYVPLEKFKVAWNSFRISGQSLAGSTDALETAWRALQTVATISCQAFGVPMGDPAWPGLADDSADRTIENITATAEWLSNRIPSFDESGMQGPNQGMCSVFFEIVSHAAEQHRNMYFKYGTIRKVPTLI